MGLMDYIRPVPLWSADKVRNYLDGEKPGEYNLIDVREDFEYEKGHIPGALHMPMETLHDRLKELDPDKPTIVY